MLGIVSKIPFFKLYRTVGHPRMLPVSLTVSLTYRCNSRCRTCRIYTRKAEELTVDEYERIFRSLGRAPYWITFSGGEPFLREDLEEICARACEACGPAIVNIPTNGLLPERIEKGVRGILKRCPQTSLVVNLSVDAADSRHDEIRGVKGSFDKAMETYRRLRGIENDRLTRGIHTVISRFNVEDIPEIYSRLSELKPDSYITEVAEERVELGTLGTGITPSADQYARAIDVIDQGMNRLPLSGLPRITRAFRTRYYKLVKDFLSGGRMSLPCYSGFASCQISPDGELWACCIRSEVMGNLRETGFDFPKAWFSERAQHVRRDIRKRSCACPLANSSYTNMLFSVRTLARVAAEVAPWH